jgi:hypothetical protein
MRPTKVTPAQHVGAPDTAGSAAEVEVEPRCLPRHSRWRRVGTGRADARKMDAFHPGQYACTQLRSKSLSSTFSGCVGIKYF